MAQESYAKATVYIGYTQMVPTHTVQLCRIQLQSVSLSGMKDDTYTGPQGVKLFAGTSKTQTGQTIQHLITKLLKY